MRSDEDFGEWRSRRIELPDHLPIPAGSDTLAETLAASWRNDHLAALLWLESTADATDARIDVLSAQNGSWVLSASPGGSWMPLVWDADVPACDIVLMGLRTVVDDPVEHVPFALLGGRAGRDVEKVGFRTASTLVVADPEPSHGVFFGGVPFDARIEIGVVRHPELGAEAFVRTHVLNNLLEESPSR